MKMMINYNPLILLFFLCLFSLSSNSIISQPSINSITYDCNGDGTYDAHFKVRGIDRGAESWNIDAGNFQGSVDCVDESLIDPNAAITFLFEPVCGCDGISYGNPGGAETQGGVTNYTSGDCSGNEVIDATIYSIPSNQSVDFSINVTVINIVPGPPLKYNFSIDAHSCGGSGGGGSGGGACPSFQYEGPVSISPNTPTEGQNITITVGDVLHSNGCDDPFLSATLSGNRIDVTINRPEPPPGTICTQAILYEDETYTSQNPIPVGTYDIYVDECYELTFTVSGNASDVDCSFPVNVFCNIPYEGSTAFAANNNSSYSCISNGTFQGAEAVHQFVKENTSQVNIKLEGFGSRDLDVFLLNNSCSSSSCIRASTNNPGADELITTTLSAGTYYIIVESQFSNSEGDYILTIEDNSCSPNCEVDFNVGTECADGNTGVAFIQTGGDSGGQNPLFIGPTYIWSNGETGTQINGLTPGDYSVTATDAGNGCLSTKSFTIESCAPVCNLSFSVQTETTCSGTSNGVAFVDFGSGSGGGGSSTLSITYEYLWSSGERTSQITNKSAGTYSVTVTEVATQCTETRTATISNSSSATLSLSQIAASCGSSDGRISVNATGGIGPFDINVNGSSFTTNQNLPQSVTGLSAGTHSIEIIDNNGCITSQSIAVETSGTSFTADAGNPQTLTCSNTSVMLGGNQPNTGFTFSWMGNGITSSNQNNPNPIVSQTGTYILTMSDANGCSASDEVIVNGSSLPTVTIEGNNAICLNTSSSLSARAAMGAGNYTFLWEDGSNTNTRNISPNQQTTYTVTVTDGNGCEVTDEITVNVLDPATNIGQDVEICQGETVVLDAIVDNATYQWSTGQTTKTIEVANDDTYRVTVTLGSDCTATDDLRVTVHSLPMADAGPSFRLTCDDPTATLQGDNSSVGAVFEYIWSSENGNIVEGERTLSPIVNSAGIYNLQVRNMETNCVTNDQVSIEADDLPPSINLGNNQTICLNEEVQLGVQCNNCTYLWEDGSTNPNRTETPLSTTTYSVTATNDKGCSIDDNIFIEVIDPNFDLGENKIICDGEEAVLNADISNATFQWSNGETSRSIVVTDAGPYTVTVTVGAQCPASDNIEVIVNPLPIVNAGATQKITCESPQVQLDGSASSNSEIFNYSWSSTNGGNIVSGNNTLMPIVDEAGTYELRITNSNTSCQNSASVEISIEENIPRSAEVDFNDLSCTGSNDGQIEVTSVDGGFLPFTYSLDGILFQEASVFQNLTGGNYQVIIKDDKECELVLTDFQIEEPAPLGVEIAGLNDAGVYADSELNLEAIVQNAQGFVDYIWEGEKIEQNNQQQIIGYPSVPSVYTLKIIDEQNCEAFDSIFVPVIKFGEPQDNVLTPGSMDGMNDNLEFPDIEDEEKYPHNEITIFNRWGQQVFHAKPYLNDWNGISDNGKNLPEGTYYYIIKLNVGEGDILHGNILLIR